MVRTATDIPRKAGTFHAVRFYENEASLCRIVAEFLGEGLITGQPALVIGTDQHRAGIVEELAARHIDVERLRVAGDVLLLDARELMATFMVRGVPDAELFEASARQAIKRLRRGRKDRTIRAYGEMVDLLWKDDRSVAAIQLEILWNKLAASDDFSLLCGYAMGNFYKDASVDLICQQHTHVIATPGPLSRVGAEQPVNQPPSSSDRHRAGAAPSAY